VFTLTLIFRLQPKTQKAATGTKAATIAFAHSNPFPVFVNKLSAAKLLALCVGLVTADVEAAGEEVVAVFVVS
jgi:hypothetical protein